MTSRWALKYFKIEKFQRIFNLNCCFSYSVLFKQKTITDEGIEFFDPNTLSDDGTIALDSLSFSPDGSIMAYSLSEAGSDWVKIKFRDVETGGDYLDVLEHVRYTSLAWTHDNKGIFYNVSFQTFLFQNTFHLSQSLFWIPALWSKWRWLWEWLEWKSKVILSSHWRSTREGCSCCWILGTARMANVCPLNYYQLLSVFKPFFCSSIQRCRSEPVREIFACISKFRIR